MEKLFTIKLKQDTHYKNSLYKEGDIIEVNFDYMKHAIFLDAAVRVEVIKEVEAEAVQEEKKILTANKKKK